MKSIIINFILVFTLIISMVGFLPGQDVLTDNLGKQKDPDLIKTSATISSEQEKRSSASANWEQFQPIPLPHWNEAIRELAATDNKIVTYDLVNQTSSEIELQQMEDILDSKYVEGKKLFFQDDFPEKSGNITPLNFSDLQLIADPDLYPWSVNVKLYMTFPSGNYVGSGVLIDGKYVLTAGHCVYEHEGDGAWASSIRVVPAYEDGNEPFGDAYGISSTTWTGWVNDQNFDWDIGFIMLDRPVGALAGWHGYGYNDDDSFFTDNTFHNPGYPAASPYDGEYMYYWYGNYDVIYTHILYHDNVASGGQSGSGSYYIDGSNRRVYATVSHLYDGSQTGHTRINSDKFNGIQTTISNNTPSAIDLVALNVTVEPSPITAGEQLSAMTYVIHNYSSVTWSGTVGVDVYISTNDIISTDDTYLQSRSFTGTIGPKGTLRITASGSLPTIPSGLDGDYWIGIILDISDNDTDNNNTEGWDAAPIHVNPADEAYNLTMAANPAAGGTTSPAPGVHVYDGGTEVTLTATAAAGYEFTGWSGDVTGMENPTSIVMDGDRSVTANFARVQVTLTMAVNPTGGGVTNPTVGDHVYDEGTEVTLTATAAAGYQFTGWSGDVTGMENPTSIVMDGDRSVTANFARVQVTLTMAVNPTGGGVTNPTVGDHVYDEGTEVTLTATAAAGYQFTGWSGDVTGMENPTSIVMDGDRSVTANFARVQVTLTMAVNPTGGGVTNPTVGDHVYDEGTEVTLTATAAAGYQFTGWLGDVTGTANPTSVVMDGDKSVTANFARIQHTLTMAVNPSGGGTTSPAVGDHVYDEGTEVPLTATPAAGYQFTGWTGDVTGTANPTSVVMDGDKSVTANFARIQHTLTMAVNPSGGGTTSPAVGDHVYDEGTEVPLTATPAAGYQFTGWSGDVTGMENPTSIVMDGDRSVTANFARVQVTLTMAVNPTGGGVTNPTVGDHVYDEGTEVTLTATAAAGYEFTGWLGDVTGTANPTSVVMDGDKSVTANFAHIQHTLTMAVNPSGGGTTSPAVGTHVYDEGTEVPLTAAPAAGYQFTGWTGDVTGTANPTSVVMDGDKSVTANFARIQHTLTMAVNPSGGGTTSPAVGDHVYDEGTEVPLTATPAAGYQFTGWLGDVTGTANPTSVVMDGDKSVTANFARIQHTLTMAVNPSGGGTTSPAVGTHVYDEGTEVPLTATPAAGYQFTGWTGDVTGTANPTSVVMDGDKSVTANFARIQHTLTMAVNPAGGGVTNPTAGTHVYDVDTEVTITATANPDWQFVNWTGDVADANSIQTTVTMDGNKMVTANFVQVKYTLTMAVSPAEGGFINPTEGDHEYVAGTEVTITATANPDWEFVNWTGDVADANSAQTTITIDGNKTVTANFEEIPVGIWATLNEPPKEYRLEQNFPNPFNPSTTIIFGLPRNSNVILEIYTYEGRKIETLVNENLNAGYHHVIWDPGQLSSGIYFYRMKAESFQEIKKMIFTK